MNKQSISKLNFTLNGLIPRLYENKNIFISLEVTFTSGIKHYNMLCVIENDNIAINYFGKVFLKTFEDMISLIINESSKYDDAKDYFISEADFVRLLKLDKRMLFVTKKNKINRLREMVPRKIEIIRCQNERCLYGNWSESINEAQCR